MQEHQDEEFGVTQEVGALPIEGANYAFDRASKGIQRCFFGGTKKFELLGGSVDFHVTVDQQANVVAAYAERSTLGHHETEECMLKAVRSAPWPAAVGGLVATAQRSFEFTPSDDMRPPVEWDASMVQALVNENKQSVETCKSGAHGTFAATIYVATDGSPMSVGVAPPQAAMDKQRSCLLALIRELEFPSPGSWPAKVSIQL